MIKKTKHTEITAECTIHSCDCNQCWITNEFYCKKCDKETFKKKYNCEYFMPQIWSLKAIEKVGKLDKLPSNITVFKNEYQNEPSKSKYVEASVRCFIKEGSMNVMQILAGFNDKLINGEIIPCFKIEIEEWIHVCYSFDFMKKMDQKSMELNMRFYLQQMISDNRFYIDSQNNLCFSESNKKEEEKFNSYYEQLNKKYTR